MINSPIRQNTETLTEPDSERRGLVPEQDEDNDLIVLKSLSKGRFPKFLVYSREDQKNYIMKIFRVTNDELNDFYVRESRFTFLSHPNILKIDKAIDLHTAHHGERAFEISYLLTEEHTINFQTICSLAEYISDEKLIRTHFRHLVSGLEYLHNTKIAHLDLKLKNLVLGKDGRLKISGLDLAYLEADQDDIYDGTANFRAPEVKNLICGDPFAADIYSLGICLFAMRLGILPYFEDKAINKVDLYQLLMEKPENFWDAHYDIAKYTDSVGYDFMDLFLSMTKKAPIRRISLAKIKENAWYQGPVYEDRELVQIMEKILDVDNE